MSTKILRTNTIHASTFDFKEHSFKKNFFKLLAKCSCCSGLLIGRKSYRCSDCNYSVHKQCMEQVSFNCVYKSRIQSEHTVHHNFKPSSSTMKIPKFCDHCGQIQWNVCQQGFKCMNHSCKMGVHTRCRRFIPNNCGCLPQPELGSLLVNILHSDQDKAIIIDVIEAKNLVSINSTEVYCKLTVWSNKNILEEHQTCSHHDSINPKFEDSFTLTMEKQENLRVEIGIYIKKNPKHELLGCISLTLDHIKQYGKGKSICFNLLSSKVAKYHVSVQETNEEEPINSLTIDNFDIKLQIGKGSFGRVFLANHESNADNIFALKVISKANLQNLSHTAIIEHKVTSFKDLPPYICELSASFQNEQNLFMLMPFCGGGELLFHLLQNKHRCFDENRCKFYLAEISIALFYLHHKGIAYRDVKPENIMLDNDGHIKLVDFGFCIENVFNGSSKAEGICGTLEYMAPEILRDHSYDCSVDLWSLGVLAFEMLTGNQPYQADNNTELLQLILLSELVIPPILSADAKHFIRSLLQINPQDRLGYSLETGEANFRAHPFFSRIEWEKLENRHIKPPFTPRLLSNTSVNYFSPEFISKNWETFYVEPTLNCPQLEYECFNFISEKFHSII